MLALVVRFATIGEQSVWLDEAYTVHLVRLGLGSMLHEIPRSESTPPLYYVLAWFWTRLFGSGEIALRSISALAGTGTVAVGAAIARRLGGARAALIAGTLLALSPLMVWFSQEARAYSLAALLAGVSVLCLIAYADSDRSAWLGGWTVAAVLGLATHYFVGFIVLAGVVWLLWRRRQRARVRAAIALVGLTVVALAPLALSQRGTGHADFIGQSGLGARLLQVPKQFLVGYASPGQAVSFALAAVLVLVGAAWPLLAGRRTLLKRSARLALSAGAAGIGVPIVLALVGVDYVDTRNMLPALAPLTAVAATGFAAPRVRPQRAWLGGTLAGALALLLAIVLVLVDTHVAYQRPDWRGASQALGRDTGTRVIIASPASALLPLQVYQPQISVLPGPEPVREIDLLAFTSATSILPPLRSLPIPAGFRLVNAVRTSTFTVLRFRAARPVTLTLAQLLPIPVGPARTVLVETRRG